MPSFRDNLILLPSQMIGIEQRGLEDEHVEKAISILGIKKNGVEENLKKIK